MWEVFVGNRVFEFNFITLIGLTLLILITPITLVFDLLFIIPEIIIYRSGQQKRQPKWFFEALKNAKTPEERSILRSKTFPGIAKAMAEQWTNEDRLNNLGDDDCE